jgi:hypothetical protein
MEFRDYAANETAALIKRLRARWSEESLHELQRLRHALDVAAQAAETAVTTEAHVDEPDGPIGALVEGLTATAHADAEAAAHQALAGAQATVEALQRDLQERAAEQAQLIDALDEVREQAKALQSALDNEQGQAAAARAELANANVAHASAEVARQTIEAAWHDTNREHDAVRGQLEELRGLLDATRAECVSVTTQLENEATERAKLAEALSTAHTELQIAETERRRLTEQLDAATARAHALQQAQDEQEHVRRDLQARVDAAVATEAQLRQQATQAEQAMEQLHADVTSARQAADSARSDREQADAEGQARLDEASALRATVQTQLDAERATNASLLETVEAERQRAHVIEIAAQAEVQAVRAELEAGEARLQALDVARAEMQQARDEAEGRLGAEILSRAALAEALEGARQAASHAQSETKACRDELEAAAQRIQALEEAHRTSGAEARTLGDQRGMEGVDTAPLYRVRRALQAFEAVTTVNDVLDTLVEQLAHEFAKVAVFTVRHNRLEGSCSRGFDPTTNIKNIVIPLTIASPLACAVTDQTPATFAADANGVTVGLFGGPVAYAMVLPVLEDGRVIAVAYAEHPQALPAGTADTGPQIAEILTDHVSRRLTARQSAASAPPAGAGREELGEAGATQAAEASPAYPGPTRQARRVKMREAIEVQVDGSTSLLVDLSSLGAQILSPGAMRPKQPVRMLLPREDGAFPCKGRIVWACFEPPDAQGTSRYRAGVTFTEADAAALEAFLVQHSVLDEQPHVRRPHTGTRQ